MRKTLRLLVMSLGCAALPATSGAQSLPVDQQYCNVVCEGPASDALCSLGVAGGSHLVAQRGDLQSLPGGDGVVAGGALAIPTSGNPDDAIVLAEAYLELRFAQPGPGACNGGFDIVRGQARLPVPATGVLASADVQVLEQPMAAVGFDLGRNLIASDSPWCAPGLDCACVDYCLDVPVPDPTHHYFFFLVDARYSFQVGAAVLDSPGGSAAFILDPGDPYFFLTGSVMGVPGVKTPFNAGSGGFGFSYHAQIPYVPLETFGFEDRLTAFRGDYAATIAAPLFDIDKPHLSIELVGSLVMSLDPDHDGDHPFLTPAAFAADPDLALGANGAFSVSWSPFDTAGRHAASNKKKPTQRQVLAEGSKAKKKGGVNGYLGVDLELATASAGARVHPDYSEIFVTGRLGTGTEEIFPSWMPLPVRGAGSVSLAGYFSTHTEDSYLTGLGEMEIDPTFLGKLAGAGSLSTVEARSAELRVDKNGFLVVGHSSSRLHRDVEPTDESELELYVAPNGYDSHLVFRGPTRVAGEDFGTSELVLGPRELAFSADWHLDAHTIALTGRFRGTGGRLTGSTTVEFPYSSEDTKRKLELAKLIAKQDKLVATARKSLDVAGAALDKHLAEAQAAEQTLDLAIAGVQSWETRLAQLDAQIAGLNDDLDYQLRDRNCNSDYTGCGSCSYGCDCSCGTLDFVCQAKCATCSAAYGACVTARETCRAGNVVGCNASRAAEIVRLQALIVAKAAERVSVSAAHDAALAVLGPARAANDVAQVALATARAAADGARSGLDAALSALASYQNELDRLPKLTGTVEAVVSVDIRTSAKKSTKTGRITAKFNGRSIARGRVDLDASPRQVCITLPLRDVGELCTTL